MLTSARPLVMARTTWDGLSAEIRVGVRQIHTWRKIPGAPATPNPTEWRRWIAERNEPIVIEDESEGDDGPSMSALKRQRAMEEVRKLKIVNDARDKRLKEAWRQAGIDAAADILRRARGGLLGLLPSRVAAASAGKSGAEIELIVRREVESVLAECMRTEPAPA